MSAGAEHPDIAGARHAVRSATEASVRLASGGGAFGIATSFRGDAPRAALAVVLRRRPEARAAVGAKAVKPKKCHV